MIAGAAGILWFAAWQLVVHESPTVHPTISDEEKRYIEKSFDQGNVRIPGLLLVAFMLSFEEEHLWLRIESTRLSS